MNGPASMNDDEIITVGRPLPRIAAAVPLERRKVSVQFQDGREKIVDLAPALASRRIYIPLRADNTLFRSFRVSEFGDAIEWSDDLDFSAVWLERLPPVGMSNVEFRRMMDEAHYTLDGMAAALEISRRQVADYRDEKRIPNHIALATRYLAERSSREVERA